MTTQILQQNPVETILKRFPELDALEGIAKLFEITAQIRQEPALARTVALSAFVETHQIELTFAIPERFVQEGIVWRVDMRRGDGPTVRYLVVLPEEVEPTPVQVLDQWAAFYRAIPAMDRMTDERADRVLETLRSFTPLLGETQREFGQLAVR